MLIQNLVCIPIVGDGSEKKVYLTNDFLEDKKINGVFFYSGTDYFNLDSPFTGEQLTDIGLIQGYSMFLTLLGKTGKPIFSDVSFDVLSKNMWKNLTKFVPLRIDQKIDFEKSFFNYKTLTDTNINILFFVSYETHTLRPVSDSVNGSVTYNLPSDKTEFYLSDIVNNTLIDKKIKKIIITPRNITSVNGYLDIELQNGNKIEYFPITMLMDSSPEEVYFDGISIDFERTKVKTFHNLPSTTKITFIY